MIRFFYLLVLSSLATICTAAEPLYFSAPPREGGEPQSRMFYQPVIEELERILETPVEFKYRENFFKYGSEMRKGGYDIVFDGPHFATWRINHLGHLPIVSLPGHLKFMVITEKSNTRVTDRNSLVAKKICGPSIPNLATLSAMATYTESLIRQPIFEAISGGMKGSYKAFKEGRCDAVVLRDNYYLKKLSPEEREKLRIVFVTKPLPNQTITASIRLSPDNINRLKQFFTSESGRLIADNLLNKFSKNQKNFIEPDSAEFNGLDQLLIKNAWGWLPEHDSSADAIAAAK